MTREETKQILNAMMVAYPNYKPVDLVATVNLWSTMLSSEDYGEVSTALGRYIATDRSGFAPAIGQLLSKMRTDEVSEPMEAWAMVAKAIRRSAYYSEEEYDALPPLVQKAVGAPVNLQAWSQLPSATVHSVAQSQFISAYKAVVERAKEEAQIPQSVADLISDTVKRLSTS